MSQRRTTTQRVVIVGGGVSGLSIAVRLAQSGLPVTLFEASKLGYAASTRNQGWLYSGASFAPVQADLARDCLESLRATEEFCPQCIESGIPTMAYLFSRPDSLKTPWTKAWDEVGIPYKPMTVEEVRKHFPTMNRESIQHAFALPDRAMRTDTLLARLAATARNCGAEIRTETPISKLMIDDDQTVNGVVTGTGGEISARVVIVATGAVSLQDLDHPDPRDQSDYKRVGLKTHLMAVEPPVGILPFCVVDQEGFNHIPHEGASVFGSNHWVVATNPRNQSVDAPEVERIQRGVEHFFPGMIESARRVVSWAGVTMQAMHVEQIEPGQVPLPTVIEHSRNAPQLHNLVSVYSGRASLWVKLAEETRAVVLELLESDDLTTTRPPWTVDSRK